MTIRVRSVLAVAYVVCGIWASSDSNASATVINWGSGAQQIVNENDVAINGVFVDATLMHGGAPGTAQVIGDTTFGTPNYSSGYVSANTYGGLSAGGKIQWGATDSQTFGVQPAGASAAYKAVVGQNIYVVNPDVINLINLTPNGLYQVQIWVNQGDPLNATTFTATNAVVLSPGTGSTAGQFAIGTFAADNLGKAVISYGGTTYPILTAIALRAVPEPSSCLLLTLGGVALLTARRKRTRLNCV